MTAISQAGSPLVTVADTLMHSQGFRRQGPQGWTRMETRLPEAAHRLPSASQPPGSSNHSPAFELLAGAGKSKVNSHICGPCLLNAHGCVESRQESKGCTRKTEH